ncbi:hypothetical protein LWQ05_004990 [Salmonella enterica]|nr:hypothetical protein [Salmonella enterica]
MASIEEAVLAYFQGFVPLALAFGAIISLSLVYGSIIRFLRARWNEKIRLIEQLRADNDTQQQHIADLHNAIFGGVSSPHNPVTRHRMVVRSLHDVISMLPNRDSVVAMLVATDDYLRNIQAAARGMTLANYDANAHDNGVCGHSGFGYEGTYGRLQSAAVSDWWNHLDETPALDRAILQAVEGIISDAIPGSDPIWPKMAAKLRLGLAMPALYVGIQVRDTPNTWASVRTTLYFANEAIAHQEITDAIFAAMENKAGVSGVNSAQSDEARRESIREQYRPDYGEGSAGV